jgi:hypothetical protein
MRNSQDVQLEWQRLMRRWEIAYADYRSMCGHHMTSHPNRALLNDAALEQAKLHLANIKREIDQLISQRGQTRPESADQLQFAVIETKIANLSRVSTAPPEASDGEPNSG